MSETVIEERRLLQVNPAARELDRLAEKRVTR